ncbi:MAG: hypothetical protein AAFR58_01045 [Cyanobacteria bacterium J06627_28]
MVTSQKDQIQSLIADIERALGAGKPRTPWVKASETENQRQVLSNAQAYLLSLQEKFEAPGGWGPVDPSTGELASLNNANEASEVSALSATPATATARSEADQKAADDVLQALLTEMRFLKSSALEPLRLEMESLRAERDSLSQEVKSLVEQRNQAAIELSEETSARSSTTGIDEAQLNEFLQVLMARLQESLSVQVTQTLTQLEGDHSAAIAQLSAAREAELLQLQPTGQIEEMRQLQSRSDQLLANIDSTLQRMFETLQNNIDSYQFSLNEGIENMHSLGRQGEVIVRSLVDHLTQQLGQTTPPEPTFFPARQATADPTLSRIQGDSVQGRSPDGATTMPPDLKMATASFDTEAEASIVPDSNAFGVNTSESTTLEPATDTITSLNEVLPDRFGQSAFDASTSVSSTSNTLTSGTLPTVPSADNVALDNVVSASTESGGSAENPEDCIREDGTIDLDLLKLDIDRSEDDPALSRDDMMIDSAIADAQVAAQAQNDLAIESKVTPTSDASFLADLTLADLTVDESLADPAADPPADNGADIAADGEAAERENEFFLTEAAAALEVSGSDSPSPDNEIPAPDLAAILPDLGPAVDDEPDAEPDAVSEAAMSEVAVSESGTNTADTDTADTDTADTDIAGINATDPNQTELQPEEQAGSVATVDVTEATESDERIAPEIADSEVSEISVSEPMASETEADATDIDDRPESAVMPDLPEGEDAPISVADNEMLLAAEETSVGANTVLQDDDYVDDRLPSDMEQALVSDSQEAELRAIAYEGQDLDELTSDLEEEIVFESDLPPLAPLEAAAPLPESALIPDMPEGNAFLPESLDHALEDLEASAAESQSTEDGFEAIDDSISNEIADIAEEFTPVDNMLSTEMPPASFDDDLDFYATSSGADSESENDPAPAISAFFEDDTAQIDVLGMTAAGAAASGVVLPNLLSEEPSEMQSLAADSVAPDSVAPDSVAPDSVALEPVISDSVIPDSVDSNTAESGQDMDSTAEPVSATYGADEGSEEGNADSNDSNDDGSDDATGGAPANWFLGIDFGTTGLSAVLINQLGEQVYPLCWQVDGDAEEHRFRLPAVVQINDQMPEGPVTGVVGPIALQQNTPILRNLKLMAKAGIPDSTTGTPWMQWTDKTALPLQQLQASIAELLKTLSPGHMSCLAIGLKRTALQKALTELSGVVVGYPANWPDTYSFNIREAVLAAGLVSTPEKIFFIEESIAALLSALPLRYPGSAQAEAPNDDQQPGLYNCDWQGGTVVINAGALLTEAAIADLPANLDQLQYSDFALRSYAYAGDAIDQDIVCQLMHFPLQSEGAGLDEADENDAWAQLGLQHLTLPQPGEADRVNRHRLRQRLNDSALGREVLEAARELKIALQEEEDVDVQISDITFTISRKDLETKVFLPYIQRINRQINALLSKKDLSAQDIKQVVCTGGSASLSAIARWLGQRFPNATIIQDTYTGEYSNSCSRVAYGLGNLCHYPNVLDANRHQYNDYFLLLELLRTLPDQPLPAGGILHMLEQRGINTRACQAHVLALIEGRLPPGLIPTEGDRPLFSARSSDIETYRALAELPLFRKQGGQIYIADMQQGDRLRKHLETLLASKSQSLSEPMATTQLMAATA